MSGVQPPQPTYKRIAAKIRTQIENGEIQPGDPIPSARKIKETEGVSIATATRVAAELRAQGFAVTTPGTGTVATLPMVVTAGADRFQRLRKGQSDLDEGERSEQLGAGIEAATQEVADALGIEVGDEVAWRRRRYIDGGGVGAVSTTWITKSLADAVEDFMQEEPLPKMTFGLIEDKTGRRAVRRRDTVEIRPVPDDIAPLLGVEPGTDSLVMVNHYWDQNGEPTEYAVDWHGRCRSLTIEHDFS